MQQQFFQIVSDFNQSAIESAKRFSEFNQRTLENLFNKQSEVAQACYANSQKNVSLLAQAKDPKSFVVLQSEMVRECGETMVNGFHEGTAMLDQARNEFISLVEESAVNNSKSFKKVTDLVARS